MSNIKKRLQKTSSNFESTFDKTKKEVVEVANVIKEFKEKFEKSYLPELENSSYDFNFITKNLEEAIILLEDIDDQLVDE